MTVNSKFIKPVRVAKRHVPVSEVVGLGASTSGVIDLGIVLPPKCLVTMAVCRNLGVAAATLATLTAKIGTNGNDDLLVTAATIFAANAVAGGVPVTPHVSETAEQAIYLALTGDANLSTTTGATSGFDVLIYYVEA